MKKLVSIFVLFLAFSFGANAQDKAVKTRSPKQMSLINSKQHTLDVSNALGIDGALQNQLYSILLKKNKDLIKENITEVEKKEVSITADRELKAIFTKEQIEKLQAEGLYVKLIN